MYPYGEVEELAQRVFKKNAKAFVKSAYEFAVEFWYNPLTEDFKTVEKIGDEAEVAVSREQSYFDEGYLPVGSVHSHPNEAPEPSPWDNEFAMETALQTGLPYVLYIIGFDSDDWDAGVTMLDHWFGEEE